LSRRRSLRSARPKVRRAFPWCLPCVPLTEEGSPTASLRSPIKPDQASDEPTFDANDAQEQQDDAADDFPPDDDGFGEFDEFEEGEEGDDDFGDFDDGFQDGEEQEETSFDEPPEQPPVPAPSPGHVSCSNTSPIPSLPCTLPVK
jgi:hypothetical protein